MDSGCVYFATRFSLFSVKRPGFGGNGRIWGLRFEPYSHGQKSFSTERSFHSLTISIATTDSSQIELQQPNGCGQAILVAAFLEGKLSASFQAFAAWPPTGTSHREKPLPSAAEFTQIFGKACINPFHIPMPSSRRCTPSSLDAFKTELAVGLGTRRRAPLRGHHRQCSVTELKVSPTCIKAESGSCLLQDDPDIRYSTGPAHGGHFAATEFRNSRYAWSSYPLSD